MRNYNYDSWLTSFLDCEDEDDLTEEELEEMEALRELHLIQQYEANQD
jgi:hypothetical protein